MGLFRKKKTIVKEDFELLNRMVEQLPEKYQYLKEQVSDSFILGKINYPHDGEGCYTFTLNADMESIFSNRLLPNFFIIKGVRIWNIRKDRFEDAELHVLQGMLAGYRLLAKLGDLDLSKIDASAIEEKRFESESGSFLKELGVGVDREVLSLLDVESGFKVELEEGEMHTIKELGDGNYLAISKEGVVFGLIHDPHEVEKLFDSTADFFEALANGTFNAQEYYTTKTS